MKLGRIAHNQRRGSRSEAVILFSVSAHNFAIAAQAVEEIRDAAGVRPFAHGVAKVKNVRSLLLRDENTYFVVNLAEHLGMAPAPAQRLLLLSESPVALGTTRIDRMAEISALHPLPRAFQGSERKWYRGLALMGEEVVPVIEPAAILNAEELLALSAALPVPTGPGANIGREKNEKQLAASSQQSLL